MLGSFNRNTTRRVRKTGWSLAPRHCRQQGVSVTCLLEPRRLLRGPGADREEAGGRKVRLFLKWTEWVRSKVGRGQRRGIWLCAPWGLAPSSSCPPTPGLGQPMALPGAVRQSQAGAGGLPGQRLLVGGRRPALSPHLPDGQGCLSLPLLARGGRALCTQLPNRSHGGSLQPGSGARC